MKMYVCAPNAPRPFNLVPVSYRVRDIDHACDIVRLSDAIRCPLIDETSDPRIELITSDDPTENHTFVVVPDDITRETAAMYFDCADDNV